MNRNVIIIGAGGHGKVIADIVLRSGDNIIGFLDDTKSGEKVLGFDVVGNLDDIEKYSDNNEFIIAIGNNFSRKRISEEYDVRWYTAIHPSSQIGSEVIIGIGTVVMANAVINASASIGKHCIINTGAVVEHDNRIGNYTHLSPHSTSCGTVIIGECTHIGAGAVIVNNINICGNVVVGAGAAVISDITEQGVYVGVPARRIK